jgi:hypothetical protein
VHFEASTPEILTLCGIAQPNAAYKSWIFAAAEEPDGRYLALGGLSQDRAGGANAAWVQDWKGELVRLHDQACDLIDPPREALMYPDNASLPLGATVVHDLATDAAHRFARAFGSRQAFVAQLNRQHVFPDQPRLAPLRDAIKDAAEP